MANFESVLAVLNDAANAIIYIRDMDGRYVFVNDNYEDMLPHTRTEVIGKTNRELFGEEAAQQWEATDMLTSAAGTYTITEESLYDTRVKKWRKFVSTKAVITDSYGTSFLTGISVEIKNHKAIEYERQLAVMRARMLELLNER